MHVPIPMMRQSSLLIHQIVAWEQSANIFKERLGGKDESDREQVFQRMDINLSFDLATKQDGLQFGPEHETIRSDGIQQRLNAKPIASQHEPAPARIPQRKREHPAQ